MNPHERDDLARLLPVPAERDLPGGRRRQIREVVMTYVHQQPQLVPPSPRRPRRLVLAVALTAVLATLVAVAVTGVGRSSGPTTVAGSTRPATTSTSTGTPTAPAELSGQRVLLAAATVAERTPASTGTYWYLKVVEHATDYQWELWTRADGRLWLRSPKTHGTVLDMGVGRLWLGGQPVSFHDLATLPTTPAGLTAWLTASVRSSGSRTGTGVIGADLQEQLVRAGMIALVSQLPAPPTVRSAAFQAIAAWPGVQNLGPVPGGLSLLIPPVNGSPIRLVIDPATAQIRQTNFFVDLDGGQMSGPADTFLLTAEWVTGCGRVPVCP